MSKLEFLIRVEIKELRKPAFYEKEKFNLYSETKWAYEEVLKIVETSQCVSEDLERFIRKMDDYACSSKTESNKELYLVAHDVAEFVLDNIM